MGIKIESRTVFQELFVIERKRNKEIFIFQKYNSSISNQFLSNPMLILYFIAIYKKITVMGNPNQTSRGRSSVILSQTQETITTRFPFKNEEIDKNYNSTVFPDGSGFGGQMNDSRKTARIERFKISVNLKSNVNES